MNGPPGTLALSGGVGCGKTVAAAWAVAQKAREKYLGSSPDGRGGIWPADLHPRFVDSGELLWIPQFGKESEAKLRPLRNCALLAIDDVGTVDGVVRFVDAIVVTRHNNHLRTVVTTNLPAEQFHKLYGLRIRDRLRGSKSGGFHEIDEKSMRK
jgi:DNA replication protein DnaC